MNAHIRLLLLWPLLAGPILAQPVITSLTTDQIVIPGSNVTFSVMATGVGPLTYQWQLNGTNLPNNIITTVAGTNGSGFSGDGGAATIAKLNTSFGVAPDSAGNFFIADTSNNRIRKVDTNGIISTVAGGGSGADGGLATNASLNQPNRVAVDNYGNLFIADTGNSRIRKVDTNGIITTVAGTNSSGFSGDGGVATIANLYSPVGVAVDTLGDLFIADTKNNCIRKVDTNGIITTVAGTHTFGFSGDGGPAINAKMEFPDGLAVDIFGNLFIADTGNNRIRKVDTNAIITTVAGTNTSGYAGDSGAATNARLNSPVGLAVDAYGYIFIADENNWRIRQVDAGGIITTVAGNGTQGFSGDGGAATNAKISYPVDVAFDAFGNLLIADRNNSRIRKITLGRSPVLAFNSVTTNNAGSYQVISSSPSGSVTSSVVNLAVVGTLTPQNFAVSNGLPASLAVASYGAGAFSYQWYFNANTPIDGGTNATLTYSNAIFSESGNYLCVISNAAGVVTSSIITLSVLTPPFITSQPTNQVVMYGNSALMGVGVAGTGPFLYQWKLNGTNVYTNGIITTVAGGGTGGDGGPATNALLGFPYAVATDGAGNWFIGDTRNNRVRKVDPNGIITTVVGGGAGGDGGMATNASLNQPWGMAVDSLGELFVAEYGSNRVRKVDANGVITTVAGGGTGGDGSQATNASIQGPTSVAVDAAGNLYIADSGNNRVRKVDANGVIWTVAGTGTSGFSGDGGAAINAKVSAPFGLALDNSGNLFVSDSNNHRIRKVNANGIITTVAGNGSNATSGDGGTATNAALAVPQGIFVDTFGYIYISDKSGLRIRQVDANGIITTVAGNDFNAFTLRDGGYATNAALNFPEGVALDNSGNLLIADTGDNRIWKVITGRNPVLALNNVSANSAGNYQVTVTGPYGSVTSSNATLTVLLPPTITTQPTNTKAVYGSSTGFNVSVSGIGPFSYQWFTSSGRGAIAVCSVFGGGVTPSVRVTDGGAGYSSVPQVHFVSGGGSGASGVATVSGGQVVNIFLNNRGSGYTTPPIVQIDPPSTINAPLSNQTNAILALPAVTSADATNYFVVVTNNYGSVTSATAQLFLFLPPQNVTAQYVATGLQLQLTGTPYYPYILQSATNLTPPISWLPIFTNYTDMNGNWQFTDTNVTNYPARFYRVSTP